MRGIRSSPSTWATLTSTPRPVGDLADPVGAAGRVEPAGVGDDLDAALDARAEHLLHLREERRCVAELAVARPLLVQDQHRQLGQPVAGEHVDVAALDHLLGRREPIAEEAAAVGDADGPIAGSRRFDPHQRLPGVDLLAGARRALRRRCRRPATRPGAPSSSPPSPAAAGRRPPHRRRSTTHPQDRSGHRRDRRAGASGIVGWRVARRHREPVLATRRRRRRRRRSRSR